MQEILFKIRYFERGLSKSLKKVNFIFSFEPSPFNGQSYQKRKESETSDQSLFRLQNKFRKISLLVIYYLTKFRVSQLLCLHGGGGDCPPPNEGDREQVMRGDR